MLFINYNRIVTPKWRWKLKHVHIFQPWMKFDILFLLANVCHIQMYIPHVTRDKLCNRTAWNVNTYNVLRMGRKMRSRLIVDPENKLNQHVRSPVHLLQKKENFILPRSYDLDLLINAIRYLSDCRKMISLKTVYIIICIDWITDILSLRSDAVIFWNEDK